MLDRKIINSGYIICVSPYTQNQECLFLPLDSSLIQHAFRKFQIKQKMRFKISKILQIKI